MEETSSLNWPDYAVIGIVLFISAGIGVYYRFTGNRQKTAEEYFSANKSMGIVPLGIALMVSFVSAISILGISAEIYTYGSQFVVHYIGIIVSMFVVAFFYLPVFFNLNNMSVYEYLERRFGVVARLITSVANYLQLTLYTGIVLYAPSLAIEATTGLSSKASIILIAVICAFYSTIGGIKAVLVTDIFQAALMVCSLICILIVASGEIEGGLPAVWEIARQNNHFDLFDFRIDPTIRQTFWSLVLGGFFMCCSLYGVNQVEVQRLMTVKSLKSARLALFLNMPLLVGFGLMTSFCGLVFLAVYKDCDPVRSGKIASYDRIMPYFAATKMSAYPGLTGLFIAGIFSASLSTISALLNSLAAVFIEDYVKRAYTKLGKPYPAEKSALLGKVLVAVNGGVSMSLAFLAGSLGTLVQLTISITGSISGPVLGIFTLGLFFEGANEKGAVVGIVTALVTCLWASFGTPRPPTQPLPTRVDACNYTVLHTTPLLPTIAPKEPNSYFYLYRISYMWYSTMGVMITLVVGYAASLLFRKLSSRPAVEPDPELFTPLVAARIRRRRADITKVTNSQLFVLEESNQKSGQ